MHVGFEARIVHINFDFRTLFVGWDEGVMGMQVGEVARLQVTSFFFGLYGWF